MKRAYRLFLALTIVFLFVIFAQSCVYIAGQEKFLTKNRSAFEYLVPSIVIILVSLYSISKYIIGKMTTRNICFLKYATISLILLIQCLSIFVAIKGGFKGQTDTIKCINEAIAMIGGQQGKINNTYSYFARYGNNNFFTIMLYYFFKILNHFDLRCYDEALFIINTIMIDLSGVFALKLLRTEKAKVIMLLLCALCPTTYVWVLFTYTNTFSMPFIMGMLYFGIQVLKQDARNNVNSMILSTILGSIGFLIRPTTIIPMIALAICIAIFVKIWKKRLLYIGIMVAIFCMILFLSTFFIKGHLSEPDNDKTFPFTHWIMMGVNEKENGVVNASDVKYSSSFPTKSEKINGEWSEIKKRISKMGVIGYATLLMKKTELVWGIGSDDFQMNNVCGENVPDFYQYICGDKNSLLMIWCQIIRGVTLFLAFIECFFLFVRRRKKERFVHALSILGAILFFMIWETNKKYNICFMPLLLLLNCYGLISLVQYINIVKQRTAERVVRNVKKARMAMVMAMIAVLIVFGVMDYLMLRYENKVSRRVNVRIESHSMKYEKIEREGEVITQSFMTDRDFNEIQVTLKGSGNVEKNSYEFEVVDQKGNVVCKQSFPFKQKIVDKRMIFNFDTVRGDGTNRSYSIRITCKKEQKQGIEIGHSPLLSYDVYTKGEMKKNNTMKLTDMRFMVSCKNRF